MRRTGGRGILATACAALCVLAGTAASSAGTPAPVTATFIYTGSQQTFKVPLGVRSLHVVATGGKGASGGQPVTAGAATVTADIAVTPGKTLYVEVGGNGQNGAQATGAFNGGGLAGSTTAGGGGGASDIQTCPNVDPFACDIHEKALIVAAGSGGGGSSGDNGQGGAGGPRGLKGSDAVGVPRTSAATGGNPGSGGSGGAGGHVSSTSDGACVYSAGGNQQGGSSFGLKGGIGGAPEMDNDGTLHGGGGGGGGGGYFGGGGGGGGTQVICNDGGPLTYVNTGGAGAGGGSSYVQGLTEQQTALKTTTDTTGIPTVVITYDPPSLANLGVKISGPKSLKKGAKGTFEVKVKNAGPDADTNVAIDTDIAKGLRVVHVALSGGSCFPGSTHCAVDKLKAGRSAKVKVKAKATKPGKQKLKATVSGDAIDSPRSNNTASLTTNVKKPRR
ncbi:hypothetical protein BH10ACT11_BH10ACT11_02430 [soil metagenome]